MHGLRGRVEREREQHLTCGKLRVDARPVYVMYGARREREEAGRCHARPLFWEGLTPPRKG